MDNKPKENVKLDFMSEFKASHQEVKTPLLLDQHNLQQPAFEPQYHQPQQNPHNYQPVYGGYQTQQPILMQPTVVHPTVIQPMITQPTTMVQLQPVMIQTGAMHSVVTQPTIIHPNMQPVVQQTVITHSNPSQGWYCSYCNKHVDPYTTSNFQGWVFVALLCLCFFPLAWVPFVMSACYNKQHHCPFCSHRV